MKGTEGLLAIITTLELVLVRARAHTFEVRPMNDTPGTKALTKAFIFPSFSAAGTRN